MPTVEKACVDRPLYAPRTTARVFRIRRTLARDIPDLDLDHPWALEPKRAIELALPCEAAGLGVRCACRPTPRRARRSISATCASTVTRSAFSAAFASTATRVSCVLLAAARRRHAARLLVFHRARPGAISKTSSRSDDARPSAPSRACGARKLATRHAPVLFVPEIARGLFAHFLGAIRAAVSIAASSFLLGAAGMAVFPRFVADARTAPHQEGLASSPFDDEGVATPGPRSGSRRDPAGLRLDSYSARKLGLRPPGNADGMHNLLVFRSVSSRWPSRSSCAVCTTGFFVTELMGQGVNPVTGDYSRGASGFWVRERGRRLPRPRDHDRRQSEGHVPQHSGARQRPLMHAAR